MLEKEEIGRMLTELDKLGQKVKIEKFERSQVKDYRGRYVECVEVLSAHINQTKDKALSVEAKKLLHFNEVYRKFQWITGLMAAGISLVFVLIIYLYMMEEMNLMYAISVVGAVGAFFAIRYAQKFTFVLAQEIQKASKISNKLARMIRD